MSDKSPALTTRELETLHYLAQGYSDLEIAQALCNRHVTVKNCLATIRLKLGAFSPKPLNKRTNLAEFYRLHLADKFGSSLE